MCVSLLTLAWRRAWRRMRAKKDARAQGEGRNQIHLTRFLLAQSSTQAHKRNPKIYFLQFVSSQFVQEFATLFWKGRRSPYLRRPMNSAGRVTLFFLLIALKAQGKFQCIQNINTFNDYTNCEMKYQLFFFSCAHWPKCCCDQGEKK